MLRHSEVIPDFVRSIFLLVQEGGHFLAETVCQNSFNLASKKSRIFLIYKKSFIILKKP